MSVTAEMDSTRVMEKLDKIIGDAEDTIREGIERAAAQVLYKAESKARETLKKPESYINHFYTHAGDSEVVVGNDHRAARFLEFGTKSTEPKRILHSALDPKEAAETLNNVLRRIL